MTSSASAATSAFAVSAAAAAAATGEIALSSFSHLDGGGGTEDSLSSATGFTEASFEEEASTASTLVESGE